jgi:hypothetical protein
MTLVLMARVFKSKFKARSWALRLGEATKRASNQLIFIIMLIIVHYFNDSYFSSNNLNQAPLSVKDNAKKADGYVIYSRLQNLTAQPEAFAQQKGVVHKFLLRRGSVC